MQERVASAVIKRKAEEAASTHVALKTGGKPLQVSVGPPEKQRCQVTHDSMKKIQDHAHLTLTQTLIVAADMRIVTKDRKLFEPHLRESLVERNHCLDELFSKTVYEGEPVVCLFNNKAGYTDT